jgi:murein DD-endopeptidase MepM/ murein hydrolase activator NlpD
MQKTATNRHRSRLLSFVGAVFFTLAAIACVQRPTPPSGVLLLHHPRLPLVFELDPGERLDTVVGDIALNVALDSVILHRENNDWLGQSGNHHAAEVFVKVDGTPYRLWRRPYEMPAECGRLRLYVELIEPWDGAAGYAVENTRARTVRFSAVPRGRPWGSIPLAFPLRDYRWHASSYQNTWAALVPYNLYYYHRGEDFGAIPNRLAVVSPLDGRIVTSAYPEGDGRSNSIVIAHPSGLRARLAHIDSDGLTIRSALNTEVRAGDSLGFSGQTWDGRKSQHMDPHLHMDLSMDSLVLSSFPFLMEAYLSSHPDEVIAIAGGYRFGRTGDTLEFDASRSLSGKGKLKYTWILSSGDTVRSARCRIRYGQPGLFSEELIAEDANGLMDRDYLQVRIAEPDGGRTVPWGWIYHHPTRGLQKGDTVLIWNRIAGVSESMVDLGDGTDPVPIAEEIRHRYGKPGRYRVTVSGTGTTQAPASVSMEIVVE